MRRTFLSVGLFGLGLVAAAFVGCAADGTAADDVDGAAPDLTDASRSDGATNANADAGAPDASPDVDASPCSEDHWCPTVLPQDTLQLTAVWSFAENDVLAASVTHLLHWDGAAWSNVDEPLAEGLTSLWATSSNEIWGVSQFDHRLVHGTRNAAGQPFTWSETRNDFDAPSFDIIRGGAPNELWVFGTLFGKGVFQHGVIATGADAGADAAAPSIRWTSIDVDDPTLATMGSFLVTEGNEVWIAGLVIEDLSGAGAIVHGVPSTTKPGTYEWTHVFTGRTGDLDGHTAIWGQSAASLWSIGSTGENYRGGKSSSGTISFEAVPSNAKTTMRSIWGTTANDLWVVGKGGAIRHWDGATWSVSRLAVGGIPTWNDLNAVHGGATGVWAVGNGVALHRSSGGSP